MINNGVFLFRSKVKEYRFELRKGKSFTYHDVDTKFAYIVVVVDGSFVHICGFSSLQGAKVKERGFVFYLPRGFVPRERVGKGKQMGRTVARLKGGKRRFG